MRREVRRGRGVERGHLSDRVSKQMKQHSPPSHCHDANIHPQIYALSRFEKSGNLKQKIIFELCTAQ